VPLNTREQSQATSQSSVGSSVFGNSESQE
jgi:hypothetical protein